MTQLLLRRKYRKILIRFLEFPSVKFLKIWQRSYSLLAFLAFNLSEKFVRQGFRSAKKNTKMLKTKKLPWQPLLFSILKVSSCQTIPVLRISENFTEGNWRKLKSKPKRRQKVAMFKYFLFETQSLDIRGDCWTANCGPCLLCFSSFD